MLDEINFSCLVFKGIVIFIYFISICFSFLSLSWDQAFFSLIRIQSRLYKTIYIFDMKKALFIQKVIFNSNTARLLAIRNVTQIDWLRKVAGIDGKTYISFIGLNR